MSFANGVSGYFLPEWAEAGTAQEQAEYLLALAKLGGNVGAVDGVVNNFVPQELSRIPRIGRSFENCTFPAYQDLNPSQRRLLDPAGGIDIWGGENAIGMELKASFLNITGALSAAGIDYGDARLQPGGIQSDRLLFAADSTTGLLRSVQSLSKWKFIHSPPSDSYHPGMSSHGGRQARVLNSLQIGIGPRGAFADIDRGNPWFPIGLAIHFGEIISPGKTDPFEVGRSLGKKVTGYTCRRSIIYDR